MFSYWSIDECCFTVAGHEYYDLPSCGEHKAGILDINNSYGASPGKRNGVLGIDIDILVNCNWVDTGWQQYSTHLHTNSTQNNTINGRLSRIQTQSGQTKIIDDLNA